MHMLRCVVAASFVWMLSCAGAAVQAQALRVPLTGTVVDEDGQPVTDATVEVFRGEGRGFPCLDLELSRSWVPLQRLPVDKHGRFGVHVPAGLVLRVQVVHGGHARWRRDDLTPGDELPIVLSAPCTLRGQLRLAGKGTEGRVRAWNELHTELFDVRTDADGKFAFDDLPAGRLTCVVTPDVATVPRWWRAELVAITPLEQTFDLEPGVLLQGRVTDAVTGRPIAGARIGENWVLEKVVVTDADGRYTMRGYGQSGAPDVQCIARGYERAVHARPQTVVDPTRLDFALQPGGTVTGTVVDPQGKPRAGVYVAAIGGTFSSARGGPSGHMWLPTRTDADGRFTISGVRTRCAATLMLRCDGFASSIHDLPSIEAGVPLALGELALQAANVVRGTATSADGTPLANVEVQLLGANTDRARLAEAQKRAQIDLYVATRTARTDAHGNFAFGDVPIGRFRLGFPKTPRLAPAAFVEVNVVPDTPQPPIRLVR